jgi:transcriptional regulator with XRE-family HTH domain
LELAERIRTARKSRQLSQEELAQRAGLSLRAYRSLERGEAIDPHYSTLTKIADGLGVPVRALIEEDSPKVEAPTSSTSVEAGDGERRDLESPVDKYVEVISDLEGKFEEDPSKLREHFEKTSETRDITLKLAKNYADGLSSGLVKEEAYRRIAEAQTALGRLLSYFLRSPAGQDLEITGDPRRRSSAGPDRDANAEAG